MKCIASPGIATVGDTPKAYLQRIVAIFFAISCLVFSFTNLYEDCRMFKVTRKTKQVNSTNFTESVEGIWNNLGRDFEEITRLDLVPESVWNESEAVFIGVRSYAIIDYEEKNAVGMQRFECLPFYDDEGNLNMNDPEEIYYNVIQYLEFMVPYLGVLGIVLASVELLCCNWYLTVVTSAFSFGLAAFLSTMCDFYYNFYFSLYIMGGYSFAAVLVIMGLRPYPFCLRKNRDPRFCKTVDAEVASNDELAEQMRILEQSMAAHKSGAISSGVDWETYDSMEHQLEQLKKKLAQAEEEAKEASERAEKAEARLAEAA